MVLIFVIDLYNVAVRKRFHNLEKVSPRGNYHRPGACGSGNFHGAAEREEDFLVSCIGFAAYRESRHQENKTHKHDCSFDELHFNLPLRYVPSPRQSSAMTGNIR